MSNVTFVTLEFLLLLQENEVDNDILKKIEI